MKTTFKDDVDDFDDCTVLEINSDAILVGHESNDHRLQKLHHRAWLQGSLGLPTRRTSRQAKELHSFKRDRKSVV